MCIIQIWTTCTCSGAYKLVGKSNLWYLGASLGPMQEMGMNFKHQGTVDCRQNIEMPGFEILVIQNTTEIHETWHAIMERHQHAVVQILSHCGQVWVYASHKPELLTTSMMVFCRERPTFGDETISIASYCFQVFFSCQHRTTGVLCEFLWFFGVRLDISFALSEFSMHLCA